MPGHIGDVARRDEPLSEEFQQSLGEVAGEAPAAPPTEPQDFVVMRLGSPSPWRDRANILLLLIGGLLTIGWLAIAIVYIDVDIGWGSLRYFLPHELGAILAGIFVPLAFLWLLLAYFARGREQRAETRMLAGYLQDLVYPAEGAGARVREVTAALRAQARELNEANGRTTDEARAMARLLNAAAEELVRVAERTAAALETTGGIIERRGGDIATISDNLSDQFDKIDHKLGARVEHLDAVGRSFVERAGALEDQTVRQAQTLDQASLRAESTLSTIEGTLQRSSAAIAEVGAEAERLEHAMGELVNVRADELVKAAEHTMAGLKVTGVSLGRRTTAIAAAGDNLADQVEKIDLRLGTRLEHIEATGRVFLERGGMLEDQAVHQAQALDQAGERATSSMAMIEAMLKRSGAVIADVAVRATKLEQIMTEVVAKRADEVVKAAEQTVSVLDTAGTAIDQRTAGITAAGGTLTEQINEADLRLGARIGHFEEVGRTFAERMELLEESAAGQARTLNDASAQAAAQIETVGELLREQAKDLVQAAEEANRQVQAIGAALRREGEQFALGSEQAVTQAEQARERLAEEARELQRIAGNLATQANEAEASLHRQAGEITAAAQTAETTIAKSASGWRGDVERLREQTEALAETMRSNAEQARLQAEALAEKMRVLDTQLAAQSGSFSALDARMIDRARALTTALGAQSEELVRQAERMAARQGEFAAVPRHVEPPPPSSPLPSSPPPSSPPPSSPPPSSPLSPPPPSPLPRRSEIPAATAERGPDRERIAKAMSQGWWRL
jgi:hypothetical protein